MSLSEMSTQLTKPAAVCSRMIPALPDEIFLEIGNQIVAQPTLAALCLVNCRFHHVFTPLLYRHMWIDEDALNHSDHFPENRFWST